MAPSPRKRGHRSFGSKVLIACEGAKTETGYFEGIRISRRLPTVQVVVVQGSGSDPLSVVNTAIDERRHWQLEKRWDRSDTAWAVFDGDEHRSANLDRWNRALSVAERERIHLAISNPCFELWYLLHFTSQTGEIHRDEARALLKQHLAEYEKSDLLYSRLRDLTSTAIERARQLEVCASRLGDDIHCNPTTSVHCLVDLLLRLRTSR